MTLSLDRERFFASVRASLFKGALSASQVSGLEHLLDWWNKIGSGDARDQSYMLATDYHETGAKMQPVEEIGKGKGKAYGKVDQTGKAPYGRGDVQLTHRFNYVFADGRLGLGGRLAADYDLALDPDISAQVIITGMIEGWFTGRKLADYIHDGSADYVGARHIINGSDKAELIAGYAVKFEVALRAAAVTPAGIVIPPTIRLGSVSADVAKAQELLAKAGHPVGTIDGRFGTRTKAAAERFQRAKGLNPIDGIIGRGTWAALLG